MYFNQFSDAEQNLALMKAQLEETQLEKEREKDRSKEFSKKAFIAVISLNVKKFTTQEIFLKL
jgi:hypothetical protein